MVFIWIVSGEDMYPLITPWYVKSIFHRWKMMVKVEGACLQKFCRQFVAAEAYWLTVEKFRFQMSQKNDVNLAYRQGSGKTAEALEIAKSIPWSLEMMSLPAKDIFAKETFKTLFSQTGRYNGPQSAGCPCDLNFWAMAQMFQPPCDDISSCFLVVWRCIKIITITHTMHYIAS